MNNSFITFFLLNIFCVQCHGFDFPNYKQLFQAIIQDFNSTSNSDAELSTPQLIRKAGYAAESHTVATKDGYLLTIHRIPGNESSPPVFLQHGLLGSSADWIMLGKGKALAFILADNGYDVWLGNFRGNTYSRAHVNLSVSDSAFWNFSFHELGTYDLPSMVSYVVSLKKSILTAYIGHSMGTTAFYVMASQEKELGNSIRMMFSLAPAAFVHHIKSPIRLLAPFAYDYKAIAHFLGEDEFLPQNSLLRFLAKFGCDINIWEEKICANSIFVICGFDKAQFNYTLLPVILGHTPAGTSTKTVVHFAQEIGSGHFRRYDYGTKTNLRVYNSTVPPDYDLSKISIPIVIFYADNDWLADPLDVMTLTKQLKTRVDMYKVPFPQFNHLDFVWGIDAPKLLYKRLLYMLKKYTRSYKFSNTENDIVN